MHINRITPVFAIQIALAIAVLGCSGTASPTLPAVQRQEMKSFAQTHYCLGFWQFRIDPIEETLHAVPLRAGHMHMNALAFMEPPAGEMLRIDKVVDFSPGEITVDIALTHPYPSLEVATAFDVCGILIGHGSVHFPYSVSLVFAGDDEVRLLNPDGYTRWWNPVEFPVNPDTPHQGYIDGLLGKKHSQVGFTSTLNGYKYFASDLDEPDSSLSELDVNMRGAFVPGTKCIRRYRIAFSTGNLVFNYAVDANWAPPEGGPPISIPEDFPPSANRPEAYRIEIHNMNNTLAYDPGSGTASGICTLSVYVFDWFNAGENIVCGLAQNDELMGMCNPFPSDGGETYSVYDVELWPMNVQSAGDILVWLAVDSEQSGYQGFVPLERHAVYFQETVTVAEE